MKSALPIEVDPEIMSGAPVFAGTRVPVETLFDYLMKGSSLGETCGYLRIKICRCHRSRTNRCTKCSIAAICPANYH